jgi:hypothetical protein
VIYAVSATGSYTIVTWDLTVVTWDLTMDHY